MKPQYSLILFLIAFLPLTFEVEAKDYFFHPKNGNDKHSENSIKTPFQSLAKVADLNLQPGDRILLAAGEVFYGSLILENRQGSVSHPILIAAYDLAGVVTKQKAIIDAKGHLNGIQLINSSYIQISNLDISANGFSENHVQGEMRVGVLINSRGNGKVENIHLEHLNIHDVFYENPGISRDAAEVKSANGTQRYGWGIRLIASSATSSIEQVSISNSSISNVSHTGIKLTGSNQQNIRQITIDNNQVAKTGGPGIQMSGVKHVYVANNDVNHSGSTDDSRKWGRGSGLWTWTASHVLIEKNTFMNANGPGDSAGAHIDYNCDNIVLQYNFSANNAGGFCEILGNNYNCAYRYNISVNDGHRIKGQNGAFQEGKMFWLSGYQGNEKERKGPINSYFYNNTIFTKADLVSKIAIDNRSKGVLIVNNIFHLLTPSEMVSGDQYRPDDHTSGDLERGFFKNNLFLNADNWPDNALIQDENPLIGDAGFRNPGGLSPEDYVPTNRELIDKGMDIPLLIGDPFGLIHGLKMNADFLGNPITGKPGMGAILFLDK